MGIIVRAVWFAFVGWWLGLLWLVVSMLLIGSVVLLPIGARAITKTWSVMTLKNHGSKSDSDGGDPPPFIE